MEVSSANDSHDNDFFIILWYDISMSILQKIFPDHFYKLINSDIKIRDDVIENADKMICCCDIYAKHYKHENKLRLFISKEKTVSTFFVIHGERLFTCHFILIIIMPIFSKKISISYIDIFYIILYNYNTQINQYFSKEVTNY